MNVYSTCDNKNKRKEKIAFLPAGICVCDNRQLEVRLSVHLLTTCEIAAFAAGLYSLEAPET